MFTLKLLGGASIVGPDGPLTGRVAQRRRIAALALLAMSRRPGISREKIAAILWPESDAERARRLLSDTVYVINSALGGDVVAAAADELHLRLDRMSCDARGFEDAVDRGALEEAVRLYTGPFLDGFFIDGSEEFERWAAAERERLHDRFARTLEQLAADRGGRGDARGAVECWRRLATDDPLNSHVAGQLADALARAGDRAGALQHLQIHGTALKEELGIAPPPEIAGRARELRSTTGNDSREPESEARGLREPRGSEDDDGRGLARSRAAEEQRRGSAAAIPRPSRRFVWAAAVVMVAVVAAGVGLWRGSRGRAPVTAAAVRSIAVLPFADLSPSGFHQYFSEGVAEELSTRLGRVPGLRVAGRTSSQAFKAANANLGEIARALDVDALLEGSVRHGDDRVRIAVRLVEARSGYQIWADEWDRIGADVLAVQDEIASAVIRALGGEPASGGGAATPRTVDPRAYDLYLQGRYFWHKRTRDDLTRAAALFDRAVEIAPGYAEAQSGVADAYAVLGFYDYVPPRQAFPRARAAAERAVQIDAQLAQAYASLGYVALYYDWNWTEAEKSLRRAIELNPNYSIGHQWLANYLVARGRFAEAAAAMRRAQEVDPLSLIASAALGWVHFYARDFDAAVQQCRRTLDLNAEFEQAWLWSGWALDAAGRYAEALPMLRRAADLSKRSAIALTALGRAHALSGDRPAARRILDELRRDHAAYLPAFEMAKLHLALDDRAAALASLQRAYEQRSHSLVFIAVDPQLDPLRGEPAFRELSAKMGIAP